MRDGEGSEVGCNAVQVKLGQREEIPRLQDREIITGIGHGDTEVLKYRSGGNESSEGSGQVFQRNVKSQRLQPREYRVRKNVLLAWVLDVHEEMVRLRTMDASSHSRFTTALDDVPEVRGGDESSTPVPADVGDADKVRLGACRPVCWDGGYDLWWEAVDRAELVHERADAGEGYQRLRLARFDLGTLLVWGGIRSRIGGEPHSCSRLS